MLDAVNARLNTHGSQIEELQHFVKELQAVGDLRVQRFEPPEQYNTFALGEVPAEKVVCRHSQLRRQLEETRAEVASLRADLELNASHPAATLSEPMEKVERISGTDVHLLTEFGHHEHVHEGRSVSCSTSEHLSREMDALDEEIRVELPLDSLKDKVDVVLPPEPPQLNDFQDNLSVHAQACAIQQRIWETSRHRRLSQGNLWKNETQELAQMLAHPRENCEGRSRSGPHEAAPPGSCVREPFCQQLLAKSRVNRAGPQGRTAGGVQMKGATYTSRIQWHSHWSAVTRACHRSVLRGEDEEQLRAGLPGWVMVNGAAQSASRISGGADTFYAL